MILKDKKGNIFSMELILVIFIFLMTISIITSLSENTSEKITDSIEFNHLKKISEEGLDNLINNPGSPNNWEKLGNLNNVISGLAILNSDNKTIKNSVSYDKIKKLENSYDLLIGKNIFYNQIKSSISLYQINNKIPPLFFGDKDESGDVISITRFVKCDYLSKYVLVDFGQSHTCNQNHEPSYSCGYFKIYNSYLKEFDYYLLVDDDFVNKLEYSIDDTHLMDLNFKKVNSNKIYLNDIILDKLKNNNSGIFFIHLNNNNPKSVVISIPKDLDKDYLVYDYFILNDCKLIFKTWY